MSKLCAFGASQVPYTIICHLTTLYRHVNVFIKSTEVLPTHGDNGISAGSPKRIYDNQIKELNDSLSTVWYTDWIDSLKVQW